MTNLLINIDVPDLSAAQKFYEASFDLTVGRRFGASGIELLGLGSPIYLLVKEAGTPPFPYATATRNYERHWCPVHLDFVVDDLALVRQRLLTAGAVEESAPQAKAWGTIAMYRDPFGHGLCLIQFSEAGYDAIAT